MRYRIERIANEMKHYGRPLTHTSLMFEVMNQTSDEEMYQMDSSLVDIAEKIEYFFEQQETK